MPNNYEALVAKCRAMMGSLLNPENYSELETKKSVSEAAMYLKNFSSYSDILASEDLIKINRTKLEHLLEENLFQSYLKFYRFSSGTQRKFFAYLIAEIELKYILKFIRASLSGIPFSHSFVPILLNQHSKVDFGALSAASEINEIIKAVSASEFVPIISAYLNPYKSLQDKNSFLSIDYAELETLLYDDYYKRLLEKYVPSLEKTEGETLKLLIATKADVTNISRIIRIVRLSEGTQIPNPGYADIKKYLISVKNKLKPADIEQLLKKRTASEIIDYCIKLYPSLSGYIRTDTADGDYFSIFVNKFAKKMMRRPISSLLTPYGYLTLRKYETDNIIYIIESIRYSQPQSSISRGIII